MSFTNCRNICPAETWRKTTVAFLNHPRSRAITSLEHVRCVCRISNKDSHREIVENDMRHAVIIVATNMHIAKIEFQRVCYTKRIRKMCVQTRVSFLNPIVVRDFRYFGYSPETTKVVDDAILRQLARPTTNKTAWRIRREKRSDRVWSRQHLLFVPSLYSRRFPLRLVF